VGLLERFVAGDLDAFEELFREFQGLVYGSIVRIVRDRAAAEDLTVEAFWRVYRARRSFDPERAFAPWARRIAANVAIDHLKGAPREVGLEESAHPAAVRDAYAQHDLARALRRAFAQLPPKLRAVATLALVEQEPHASIADALGISEAAVKSREFRAVRRLRRTLERWGLEP
jgi:RNA polymerase sigma-70 factor (ECF subfamily)